MENLEIKCSQLCFDTTIKIIFMNDTPINIIIHIQSITPKLFVSLGLSLRGTAPLGLIFEDFVHFLKK